MNYNILSYILYLLLTIYIIVVVGKICYQNGNVFVNQLLPNHEDICLKINQILLLAYYLLNIGYCATTLIKWQKIENFQSMLEQISLQASYIIIGISILHYCNIILLTKYLNKIIH